MLYGPAGDTIALAVGSLHNGAESARIQAGWADVPRQAVLAQLERVLESPHFRASKRCSHFLRYVIERASERRFDALKERTLGVEVFERDPNYDTNQDPIVRVTAGEVRKRLAQYYLEAGREDEIRIGMPSGSYLPEVQLARARAEAGGRTPAVPARPPIRWARLMPVAAALIGLVALAVAVSIAVGSRRSALDLFWEPLVRQGNSVLVCMGQPKAYVFNTPVQAELERWFDPATSRQNAEPRTTAIPLSEVVPVWTNYIPLKDTQVLLRLSKLLADRGKTIELHGGRSISLADLRGRPAVLVGAFNNEWSQRLGAELRFYFDVDYANHAELVRDRQNPLRTEWKIVNAWPQRNIAADYGVVSRVVNPTTEQTLVIVAGLTNFATTAAGELLTNEDYFKQVLAKAPTGWHRKNMQVVLSADVISGTAGPPRVLDAYFW